MSRMPHMRALLEMTKRPYKPSEMRSARDDAYAELERVEALLDVAQEMGLRFARALENEKRYRDALIEAGHDVA